MGLLIPGFELTPKQQSHASFDAIRQFWLCLCDQFLDRDFEQMSMSELKLKSDFPVTVVCADSKEAEAAIKSVNGWKQLGLQIDYSGELMLKVDVEDSTQPVCRQLMERVELFRTVYHRLLVEEHARNLISAELFNIVKEMNTRLHIAGVVGVFLPEFICRQDLLAGAQLPNSVVGMRTEPLFHHAQVTRNIYSVKPPPRLPDSEQK